MTRAELAAQPTNRPIDLGPDALFLVWGPVTHGRRSAVLSRELGVELRFVASSRRRGVLVAPFKYASMGIKTAWILATRRPRTVLVQSPPTPAVMIVAAYAWLAGARFLVDAHSDAMLSPIWTRPAWLYRRIARRAAATIVTNEHFAQRIRRDGGRAAVVPDVPTSFEVGDPPALGAGFHLLVVNSFAPDEPLREIVAAAAALPEVTFHVTGDQRRPGAAVPEPLPRNVSLTGYLADPAYYALMSACDAVMCLTTRDHTMQRGACESLWMQRPIVTSSWSVLQEYFDDGTVHVASTADEIREGVRTMVEAYPRYVEGIHRLATKRRREWWTTIGALGSRLEDPARRPTDERMGGA